MSKLKIGLGFVVIFLLGWTASYIYQTKSIKIEDKYHLDTQNGGSQEESRTRKTSSRSDQSNMEGAPSYVLETLEYIHEHNEAPSGYVGGRVFQNREGRLPKSGPNGQKIRYREWDVHPKVKGQNRGAERIVTSETGDAYYTSDHYQSFQKIN